MEKKRYKIEIFGEEYVIISDEHEDRIVKSAETVDSLMKQIVGGSQNTDTKRIAVLTALRLANDMLILQSKLEMAEQKQNQLVQDVDKELSSLFSQ